VTQRADYAAAYRAARRILAFGEAHGFEPDTSHARFSSQFYVLGSSQ